MGFTSKTIETCQNFLGHVCTIFVHPTNRNFTEQQNTDHFVLRIAEVSVDGVWGMNANGMLSFFPWEYIIFIQQELELDPNNPDDAEKIRQYESQIEAPVEDEVEEEKAFVDIRKLSQIARDTKQSFESLENYQKNQ